MAETVVTPAQLTKWMDGLAEALQYDIPLDPFFDRAQLAMKTDALNCFDQGCDPWGNPWPTVKFRVRDSGGTLQPLRDRGVLMASVTADSAPGAIRERGADFLRYGTNIEYAVTHQYGATIVPKQAKFLTIPATIEAARAGSPLNFPRHLTPKISRDKDSGVMVDDDGEIQYYMTREVRIPPRPFLGFSDRLANKIVLILDDWLHGPDGVITKYWNKDIAA